jgi:hypothetical protein
MTSHLDDNAEGWKILLFKRSFIISDICILLMSLEYFIIVNLNEKVFSFTRKKFNETKITFSVRILIYDRTMYSRSDPLKIDKYGNTKKRDVNIYFPDKKIVP